MSDSRDTVVFVCTANICRSPLAEKLLAHALAAEPAPLKDLKVVSAGVSAFGGEPASNNSVKALKPVGLDLSQHRSRPLSQSLIDRAVAVFCMTQTHRALVEMQFNLTTPHLYLMRDLMPECDNREIPDPYGQDIRAYEACRDSMVEAIPSIVEFLRKTVS